MEDILPAGSDSWNLVALEAVDAFDGKDEMWYWNGTACKVKCEKMAFCLFLQDKLKFLIISKELSRSRRKLQRIR
jgi:hypothetical protein